MRPVHIETNGAALEIFHQVKDDQAFVWVDLRSLRGYGCPGNKGKKGQEGYQQGSVHSHSVNRSWSGGSRFGNEPIFTGSYSEPALGSTNLGFLFAASHSNPMVRDWPEGYVPSKRAYPPQAEVLLTFIQSSFDGPWRSSNGAAAKCAELGKALVTRLDGAIELKVRV